MAKVGKKFLEKFLEDQFLELFQGIRTIAANPIVNLIYQAEFYMQMLTKKGFFWVKKIFLRGIALTPPPNKSLALNGLRHCIDITLQ